LLASITPSSGSLAMIACGVRRDFDSPKLLLPLLLRLGWRHAHPTKARITARIFHAHDLFVVLFPVIEEGFAGRAHQASGACEYSRVFRGLFRGEVLRSAATCTCTAISCTRREGRRVDSEERLLVTQNRQILHGHAQHVRRGGREGGEPTPQRRDAARIEAEVGVTVAHFGQPHRVALARHPRGRTYMAQPAVSRACACIYVICICRCITYRCIQYMYMCICRGTYICLCMYYI
jgi:hypothetical protein